MVRELCDDLHYRAQSIDIAVKAGLNNRAQPSRLPDNIYGTSGDWETYSTPSRNARLKTSFVELKDQIVRFVEMAKRDDEKLDYEGTDIAGDLAAVYREEAEVCEVNYTASNGEVREIGFEEALARLRFLVRSLSLSGAALGCARSGGAGDLPRRRDEARLV